MYGHLLRFPDISECKVTFVYKSSAVGRFGTHRYKSLGVQEFTFIREERDSASFIC